MKLDDRAVRGLLEDPALAEPRAVRKCPDPAAAREVLAGTASEADRLAFVDHLVECPDCAAEYRTARSVARWSDEAVRVVRNAPAEAAAPAPAGAPLRRGRSGPWLAAAALIAAAAIAVVVARSQRAEPAGASERGVEAVAMRSIRPEDGARLAAPPSRLEWEALPGATSYEVAIYDSESSPIWRSARVTSSNVEVPADVAAKLSAGHSYLWRVVARVGLEARPSSVFGFSISP